MTALVLALLCLSPAHAQTPLEVATAAHPDGESTYEETARRADRDSPLLRGARAGEDLARAHADAARPWRSPHLRGGVATVDVSGASAPTVTSIEVSVPIEYSGAIDAEVASRVALADAEHHAVLDAARVLRIELAQAWADALEARVVLATRQARLERASSITERLERRLAIGEGSALEVAAARLEVADARAAWIAAEAEVRAAELAIAELAGSPSSVVHAGGSLELVAPSDDVDALVAAAQGARPELAALERQIEAAERARDARHRGRAPDVSLFLGWQHSFPSLMTLFNQPEYDALFFGADVEIPTHLAWDGELREADAAVQAAEAARDTLALAIEREVRVAHTRVLAAAEATRVRRDALTDARAAAELVLRVIELGEEQILAVLAAERTVLSAIEAFQRALAEEARAHLALLGATGAPLERWPERE